MNNLCDLCKNYRELQRMLEAVQAEMDEIKDMIRAQMGENDVVVAGEYKISNKLVESSRLDSTALKKALPDVAARFIKTTTIRRFMIS